MGYYMHIGDEDFNITYNVSPMFYSHNTDGIRFIYGKTGLEARKLILDMLNYFVDNESKLVALEPDNGWGTWKGTLNFLYDLLKASISNPTEIWQGD